MQSDTYGNCLYSDEDIINLLYEGKIDVISDIIAVPSKEVLSFIEHSGINLKLTNEIDYNQSVEEFDKFNQALWFIPEHYQKFGVEPWVLSLCRTEIEEDRVREELEAFKDKGLLPLLRVLRYVVDTLREKGVVWGVGRGSSVASYVLYLMDVHRIDSLRYNLDWREFLR